MRKGVERYQRTSELAMSGRETECAAFNLVTRDLQDCSDPPARLRAIGRNHTLWSLLVKDMALTDNALPDELKTELINLGLWSMRYSTLAVLRDLPVEPLIEVNRNILSGLLAQNTDRADAKNGGELAATGV